MSNQEDFLSILGQLKIDFQNDSNAPASSLDQIVNYLKEKQDRLLRLFKSDKWPKAVDDSIICQPSEEEKLERAESILSYHLPSVIGKSFLDFGTGEGHVPKKVIQNGGKISVGYDVVAKGESEWERMNGNLLLTRDLNKVRKHGPYNLISIYDVLDHSDDPVEVLSIAADLLSPEGEIHLRAHPWCSRHGGHLYNSVNKAFAHLFFSEKRLERMGYDVSELKTVKKKVLHPLGTYSKWIGKAGLKIINSFIERTQIEPFFEDNLREELMGLWPKSEKFPKFQLEQSFLDFVLGK